MPIPLCYRTSKPLYLYTSKPFPNMNVLKKISNKLFSTTASGMYMILFAIAIAVATFVENDFGTSSAQKVIFKAWWFELLLVLFGLANLFNMFKFQLIRQKKWATLAFHASMVIILLGATVTRYFGSLKFVYKLSIIVFFLKNLKNLKLSLKK